MWNEEMPSTSKAMTIIIMLTMTITFITIIVMTTTIIVTMTLLHTNGKGVKQHQMSFTKEVGTSANSTRPPRWKDINNPNMQTSTSIQAQGSLVS